jgi:DegV family protein with EDD domain
MKNSGSSLEEIIHYLENNKQNLNTYITVDDLSHLKRGGRISTAAAVLGTVLHIKPVLTINHEGRVMPVIKVKGRKNVINKLAEIVAERIEAPEDQTIAICHGDVFDEAEKLKSIILEKVKVKEVLINYIGPVVGTHGGPGALAVFFVGKDRQHHVIESLPI